MRSQAPIRKQSSAKSEPAYGLELLRNDRGIVLILCLMVIMVLSVLATAFLFLSGTESAISRNSQVVTQAFYAAEAGIDTAINQLFNTVPINTAPINPTTLVVANNTNVVFQTEPPGEDILYLGQNPRPGFNLANYSFNMYRVGVSGRVIVPVNNMQFAVTQLEVGATIGTPMGGGGTGY